jgi:hypothetical protein
MFESKASTHKTGNAQDLQYIQSRDKGRTIRTSNIDDMSVTMAVFQLPMDWLNAAAPCGEIDIEGHVGKSRPAMA